MANRDHCSNCGGRITDRSCSYDHGIRAVRRAALIGLIIESGSVTRGEEGEFTLSSGIRSNRYYNLARLMSSAEALFNIAEGLFPIYHEVDAQAVGGPGAGAIAMAAALSLWGYMQNGTGHQRIPNFWTRAQHPHPGGSMSLEGNLEPGQRILLVDDVLTTGASLFTAARFLEEEYRATVAGMAVVLDRQEGGEGWLAGQGYRVQSLLCAEDLETSREVSLEGREP